SPVSTHYMDHTEWRRPKTVFEELGFPCDSCSPSKNNPRPAVKATFSPLCLEAKASWTRHGHGVRTTRSGSAGTPFGARCALPVFVTQRYRSRESLEWICVGLPVIRGSR